MKDAPKTRRQLLKERRSKVRQDHTTEINLGLAVLAALKSPAGFTMTEIAGAIGCSLEFVECIAMYIEAKREPNAPLTQEEISTCCGCSDERIRQIERISMHKLRRQRPLLETLLAECG